MRARKIHENDKVKECELLKSHVLVYAEDLNQERKRCEELQEEIRECKTKIDEQYRDIRAMSTRLRACMARGPNRRTPLHQAPVIHPSPPVDEIHLPQNRQQMTVYSREKKLPYPKEL